MQQAIQKILVVGGNGFIGSAVCKAALARGLQVTSVSSSGRPYRTPKGHTPAWASKVDWQKGDALSPETYAHILPGVSAVVHTLGTLLEDTSYKSAVREGSVLGLAGSFARRLGFGGGGNPLESGEGRPGSYETLNRDAALRVCEAFLSAQPEVQLNGPRAFVYLSAEDVLRPWIPSRYIETKREAEMYIEQMVSTRPDFRAVYIRPSLVYHAHLRPLISPLAALLDLSATLHAKVPPTLPTPSAILRSVGPLLPQPTPAPQGVAPSPLESIANAMTIPPIHVEHVAEAVVIAADNARSDVRGAYGVQQMRELIGWSQKGADGHEQPSATVEQRV
ncbi:NAD P-binding protein [Gloeophyllum trabeum ATCC 11539]|uniref:NAD P-binding protein n=1 Tax=Gloeophyllum trabeum (strain ATCC 11539 / FP-39264 / Madison 617) TaxID=670483 RepID=S7QFV3_GLOTA|nr:NAD P-binding protein [Gloeophyllum trabeum ATCC 11539]EPQ58023.1 NAD P-binding protein [Gloeophyllum trabeum ATCC 11539]